MLRRTLLKLIGIETVNKTKVVGVDLGTVADFLLPKAQAQVQEPEPEPHWDVSFLWSKSLGSVLEYRELLTPHLNPVITPMLTPVQGTENGLFGLIYDRNENQLAFDPEAARAESDKINISLEGAGLEKSVIRISGDYGLFWNNTFGKGPNLDVLRNEVYPNIFNNLEESDRDNLVITRDSQGYYTLELKTLVSRTDAAVRRRALASNLGLKLEEVSISIERNAPVVFGSNAYAYNRAKSGGLLLPVVKRPSVIDEKTSLEKIFKRRDEQQSPKPLAEDDRTAWVVKDMKTGKLLVSKDADVQMQSASMIKPFIAALYLNEVDKGNQTYDDEAKKHVARMLVDSNNVSTNWLMQKLGGPKRIQALLAQGKFKDIAKDVSITDYIPLERDELTSAVTQGYLKIPIGKSYYSNLASANDYLRLAESLLARDLPESEHILEIMSRENRDRITKSIYDKRLSEFPEDTVLMDKTGLTKRCCGNWGIVGLPKDDEMLFYVFVGIVDSEERYSGSLTSYMTNMGNVIRDRSQIAAKRIKLMHDIK